MGTQPNHSDSTPLVSVITPVYNGADFVVDAVESILAQTYPNVESIVIDDGSPDNAVDVIQQAFRDNPRVRLVRQANAGTAAARNTGIRASRGELIAMLDQDDRWLPTKLEQQVPLFEDPKVGLVHSGGRVIDTDARQVTSTYYAADSLDVTDLMRWCRIGCATAVVRRSSLDSVGLFNSELGGVDDWDMWVRLAGAGYKVRGVREPLVEIFEHPGNQGKGFEELFHRAKVVIDMPRDFDDGRLEYRAARADAMRRLREDYYVKACRRAALAFDQGQYAFALRYRFKALWCYPEGLMHPFKRLLAPSPVSENAEKVKRI